MDMGALLPTMITRPDAQVRFGSSAGFAASGVLRDLRDRGRAGGDSRLAYVEYGAAMQECAQRGCLHTYGAVEGCALDDRALWWQANCALWAGRITEEGLEDNRKGLPPAEFAREFLSWWEEPADENSAIPVAAWLALGDPAAERGAVCAFGVATAPDRSWAAVAVAWKRPDGASQVMLADYRPGTSWIADRVAELRARWRGTVTVDIASRGLVAGAEEPPQAEQAIAHNALSDAVTSSTVRHGNEAALNVASRSAQWKPLGDTRVLDRKNTTDISPLIAAALALHGLTSRSASQAGSFMSF